MNRLKATINYLHYYIKSNTKCQIHPPFAYTLLTETILDKKFKADYKIPETIRKDMLKSSLSIEIRDFGAGSAICESKYRKIKNLVKYSAKSPKYAQLLYRLAKQFNPNTIVEIGTSLGISTAYLAKAIPEGNVISIEGCHKTAAIAKQNMENFNIKNVRIVNEKFDDILPTILKEISRADFVFFDGNHRKEPTIKYFEFCLQYIHNDSVFIFDDIHWSDDMEQAWGEIKQNQAISLTIDLYFLGIVFFKKELSKQDFLLRF